MTLVFGLHATQDISLAFTYEGVDLHVYTRKGNEAIEWPPQEGRTSFAITLPAGDHIVAIHSASGSVPRPHLPLAVSVVPGALLLAKSETSSGSAIRDSSVPPIDVHTWNTELTMVSDPKDPWPKSGRPLANTALASDTQGWYQTQLPAITGLFPDEDRGVAV